MASAASGARVRSFHRMEAKPSGETPSHRMLLHSHAVAHGQRQGAPASALAQKHAHHRNSKARHSQIVGDGVALAALLGLGAAEGALGVNQTENRRRTSPPRA